MRVLAVLLAVTISHSACATKPQEARGESAPTVVVEVAVKDYQDKPIIDAEVTITAEESSRSLQKRTDSNGIVLVVLPVSQAQLSIEVTKNGFNKMKRFGISLSQQGPIRVSFKIERLEVIEKSKKTTIR